MALAIGAAHAPSLSGWLGPELSPRVDGVDQPRYPVVRARNSSTTGNTVNMFIDAQESDFAYAASIVTACADQTVYEMRCTSGPASIGTKTCGPDAAVATVTSGSSTYQFSSAVTSATLGEVVTVTAQDTCHLAGTTAATCTATIKATISGTVVSTAVAETLSGSTYYRFDVEITGGAEKTANPTGTCGAKSAATSLSVKNMAIWALAGVIGAVSIQTIL